MLKLQKKIREEGGGGGMTERAICPSVRTGTCEFKKVVASVVVTATGPFTRLLKGVCVSANIITASQNGVDLTANLTDRVY